MQNESVDERIQALHEFVALRFREQEVLLSQLLSGSRGKSGSSYKRDELITKAVTFEADELAQEDNNKEKATSPRSIEYARLGSARRSFVRQTMAVHLLKAEKVARMTRTRVSMHRMPPSEKVTGIRGNIREMISSTWFSVFITGLIALNVILLGIEVDVSASVLDVNDVPAWFGISNLVLVVMFVLEILLKVIGLGCLDFFCGPEWYWNMFDFFVVSISVADVVLDYVAQMLSSSLNTGHLRLMRSIRLARALRSMRVLRLFRYVTALRTLVLSIMSTMGSLFWTLALLIILFYSFGLVVTQLVVDHCRFITMDSGVGSLPTCPQLLDKYWASVSESMLTLFMAITGGVSYDDAMRPLREVGSLAVGFVVLYIAIAVIVVLNVVTGVFCSTAIESATADKDVATIKQVRTKNQQVESLRGIFAEIDKSDSNEVSFQDVQDAISAGELSNFMEAMGISTDDVWSLCMLLDADKNGFIDLEEFVSGCMQLHGPAKSLQLAKMSFENKLTRQAIKNLSEDFAQFRELFLEDVAEQEDF